ncbi:MAG: SDR family oxidoreductase [Saprospiraceae bacterium]
MVTVITGASKGIGKAIALKFGKEGHQLALCARGQEDLTNVCEQIVLSGGLMPFSLVVDMKSKEQVNNFGHQILDRFGCIDILVNNTGVFLPGSILDEEDGRLEHQLETNVYSAYHLTRILAPSMKERKSGHIINMCSIASTTAYPNGGSYSISKFALLGFSKVIREELKDFGVKVTAVLPGATWSASWAGVDLPEERLMNAKDIADMIWATTQLGITAVVEEIVIRPQLGDL